MIDSFTREVMNMKQRLLLGKWVILICMAISLAACSDDIVDNFYSSEGLESSSSTSSLVESAQDSQPSSELASIGQTESIEHSSATDEVAASISASPSATSEKNTQQASDEQDVSITVKKSDVVESKEIVISDEAQIEKIASFVESIFESDYTSPPFMGSTVIEVLISREGTTEEFSFIDKEVDGYRLAKNKQHDDVKNTWYFADPKAYSYLLDLFQ